MRVAFVSHDFGEYCARIAGALAKEADVLLLLPDGEVKSYLYLLDEAVTLHSFQAPRLRQVVRQIQTMVSLIGEINRFHPDVIHLQTGHLWFNLALPLLRQYPLILTMHDPCRHLGDAESRKTPQWVFDWGCYRAKQIIMHAPQLKEALVQRLGIPRNKVHVIPHVLCGDDTAQEQVPEDEHLILFFGRVWEYKGLEYLIRAEPLITTQVPEAKIAIAGTGEDFDRYRRMMVHPDRFTVYNEYVSDDKRAELFRRASVVALPYIEASQSGVIPVAYRFGKPVVATTVGGLPAMVDHGYTGYLVPPRDEKALAAAIVFLLQNRELRKQLGANGRRVINSDCSPEVIAHQTLSVYEQAIRGVGQPTENLDSYNPKVQEATGNPTVRTER
jgi:glycosyltransferase involved in cell wall biosynthesis